MKQMMMFKQILKNELIAKVVEALFGRFSSVIFSMLFTFVCTRVYGPGAFGEYTYAFTLVTFFMAFSIAGLDNGLLYFIPKNGNQFISSSLAVSSVLSILSMGIASIFVKDPFVKGMLPLIWFVTVEQIFFSIYRSYGKIREFYFIYGFLSLLLRVILLVLFYFAFQNHVENIALAVYISYICAIFLYFYQNRSKIKGFSYNKAFFQYSFPLVLATVMGTLTDKIDIIMLGNMMTKKDTGIYQIAIQLTNVVAVLLNVFNIVFAPKISQLYHNGKMQELREIYTRSTRILGLIALLTIIILTIFSKEVLLLFGRDIVAGQGALIFRGLGQFINVAVGSVWTLLAMIGKSKLPMFGNLGALIINVILNIFLIPAYGITGAAFASMVALSFVNLLGYRLVSKELNVKVYQIL